MGFIELILTFLFLFDKIRSSSSFFSYSVQDHGANRLARWMVRAEVALTKVSLDSPEAILRLQQFDRDYLRRHELGRSNHQPWSTTEFSWLQNLGKSEANILWDSLRDAIATLSANATEVVFGIKSRSGEEGIATLRAWTNSLQLPKGILRAYNDVGEEVEIDSLSNRMVYIKYNSTNSGDAYMKSFDGDNVGVIYQCLANDQFHQYGDFPLFLFN